MHRLWSCVLCVCVCNWITSRMYTYIFMNTNMNTRFIFHFIFMYVLWTYAIHYTYELALHHNFAVALWHYIYYITYIVWHLHFVCDVAFGVVRLHILNYFTHVLYEYKYSLFHFIYYVLWTYSISSHKPYNATSCNFAFASWYMLCDVCIYNTIYNIITYIIFSVCFLFVISISLCFALCVCNWITSHTLYVHEYKYQYAIHISFHVYVLWTYIQRIHIKRTHNSWFTNIMWTSHV